MQGRIKEELIMIHEGYEKFPYKCPSGKLTIGYGRNLESRGITKEEAIYLMRNDIASCEKDLKGRLDFFENLSEARQAVLIDMCFNIGITGFLKFKNMLEYSRKGEFGKAAVEILRSEYAKQVKGRAIENAKIYESGVYES